MNKNVLTTVNDELATLLIPMNGKQWVIPNVTVAEIIPYREPEVVESDNPTWFLGNIEWRGINVPIISFEAINEEPFISQSSNRRIAVLNALNNEAKLPFCGVIAESVPRLMRIQPNEIINEDVVPGPAELGHVLVNGEQAVIPNVDFIQQQMLSIM
ncbi:MAG: chemosensory pili system protein ChpC [Pseudohongiellaceae bacterium]|jgi:chemosensory pili system protein ChpC